MNGDKRGLRKRRRKRKRYRRRRKKIYGVRGEHKEQD